MSRVHHFSHWRCAALRAVLAIAPVVMLPFVATAQEGRPSVTRQPTQKSGGAKIQTNEDLQPAVLPPLPAGMTIQMLVEGDQLFHAKGGCFVCHGSEGQGMAAAGDAITNSLAYVQHDWRQIDSLITAGLPDGYTRSPIAMPPRGARSNLTAGEIKRIAAYVWAISAVKGEPWPGGHASHDALESTAAPTGTAPKPAPVKSRLP
ncbi:MAG: c-type cytochrome [Gemmatimonadota bacterium]|nr:c-type cytochrome [Gemmatimonadota bacterium]